MKKVFMIGKYLALTPTNPKDMSPTRFHKFYAIFVFSCYALDTINSFYNRRSFYLKLSMMQVVLRVLLTTDLIANTFYSIIVACLLKRHKWSVLIKNLRVVENKSSTMRWYYFTFVALHVLLLTMAILTFYVWIEFFGLDFFKLYLGEYLQIYLLFFNNMTTCIVLGLMLTRYRYQNTLMSRLVTRKLLHLPLLTKIKNNLFVLRQTVDAFNDLFGWSILFNIFFGGLRSLICFDVLLSFRGNGLGANALQMFFHLEVMLFHLVSHHKFNILQ
jgi:gustatory receptor